MIPITPNPDLCLLPPGTMAITYAKDQPQYLPLSTLKTPPDGRVVSQWQFTENERLLLANGVPLTLVLHTFNEPLQPIILIVGGVDLRDPGVAAEPNDDKVSVSSLSAAEPDLEHFDRGVCS